MIDQQATRERLRSLFLSGAARRAWWTLAILGVLAAGSRAVLCRHVAGECTYTSSGFFDFDSAVYFPTRFMLEGHSPYGKRFTDAHPGLNPMPPYSPSHFVLHIPFALVPHATSQAACFVWVTGLTLAVAWLAANSVHTPNALPVIFCALVWSRGGQMTLHIGYITMELVLGSLLALHYGHRRPHLAGVGMLLAATKPSYLLPLAAAMACRGHWKSITSGLVMTTALSGVGMAWLLYHASPAKMISDLGHNEENYLALDYNLPVNTPTRIDAFSSVCKWMEWNSGFMTQLAVMAALLAPACLALAKLRGLGDSMGVATLSGGVAALSSLVCIYHQCWDAVLLTPLIAALLLARPEESWAWLSSRTRWALAALCLFPSFNLFSTRPVLYLLGIDTATTLHKVLTSLNALSLAIAYGVLLAVVWNRLPRQSPCNADASETIANETRMPVPDTIG